MQNHEKEGGREKHESYATDQQEDLADKTSDIFPISHLAHGTMMVNHKESGTSLNWSVRHSFNMDTKPELAKLLNILGVYY